MKKRKCIWKRLLAITLIITVVFAGNIAECSMVEAASKVSYKITNKKQVKQCKKVSAKYIYQLPQIKGNSATIKKINKSLVEDYKSTWQYRKNLFNYYEGFKKISPYRKREIYYTNKCSVTYNQNGYICFKFISEWCAGGIGETWEYGLTYRLKDGKKLGIQDVVAGKRSNVKKTIASTYSKKIYKYGYSPIMKMKYSDFHFYIKPGKKVCVCFGPYQPMGGHGCSTIVLKGKLK